MHILPLSAQEIENRLKNLPENAVVHEYDATSRYPVSGVAVAQALASLYTHYVGTEIDAENINGATYITPNFKVNDIYINTEEKCMYQCISSEALDDGSGAYCSVWRVVSPLIDQTFNENSENALSGKAVAEAIAAMVDSAPETLNTLNELAAAINNDKDFAVAMTKELSEKANKDHTHNEISELETLVGDTSVSEQINKAISDAMLTSVTVGKATAEGGEIFNDYENNEASELATAFGERSKALGYISFAAGCESVAKGHASLAIGEVIATSGDYLVKDGEEDVPTDAFRHNEAIGTGSMAMGMGAVAYSRASKSFGYRTQAGYPPNINAQNERTHYEIYTCVYVANGQEVINEEDKASTDNTFVKWMWITVSEDRYNQTESSYRRKVIEVEPLKFNALDNPRNSNSVVIESGKNYFSYNITSEMEYDIETVNGSTTLQQLDGSTVLLNISSSIRNIPLYLYWEKEEGLNDEDGEVLVQGYQNNSGTSRGFLWRTTDNGITYNSYKPPIIIKNGGVFKIHDSSVTLRILFPEAKTYYNFRLCTYPEDNSGQAAFAIGNDTTALGNSSFSGGNGSRAVGAQSFAFGSSNTQALGSRSIAMGYGAIAEYQDSIALNRYTKSSGLGSAAFGILTHANGVAQTVVGKANEEVADALFIVGNGDINTGATAIEKQSNAFVVTKDGDVSISGKLNLNGTEIVANGDNSFAVGVGNYANGTDSIALGSGCISNSQGSVAMGLGTAANGFDSFAMGDASVASGDDSVAIGLQTEAYGNQSVALGCETIASGNSSFAMGNHYTDSSGKTIKTTASGSSSIAMGSGAIASGLHSVSLGSRTEATNERAVALGNATIASGKHSFASNLSTVASGHSSVAMGRGTKATTTSQMAVGAFNAEDATARFIIGGGTSDTDRKNALTVTAAGVVKASGDIYANGDKVLATKEYVDNPVDANSNILIGSGYISDSGFATQGAILIGQRTKVFDGNNNVVIGTNAASTCAQDTVVIGHNALAKDFYTVAIGSKASGAEHCVAIGADASAGYYANAIGQSVSVGPYQTAIGRYNAIKNGGTFYIGNGTSDENRSNLFEIYNNGDVRTNGQYGSMGADYAEMFEWQDGNPEGEDRIGYIVTLDGDKIRKAQLGDEVLGVISGTAAVLGDSAAMNWKDKYVTDEFGRIIYDMVEEFRTVKNRETGEETKESIGFFKHPRINPNFNPDKTYIPREERPEWGKVGLMGKLYARDDGTCVVGGYATVGVDGILTYSETPTNICVMKRTNENIVFVMLK
jgi:hypothetical protein